jgi:hypothetical protein
MNGHLSNYVQQPDYPMNGLLTLFPTASLPNEWCPNKLCPTASLPNRQPTQ